MSKLFSQFKNQIIFDLQKKLDLPNIMLVPRLEKIVINIGCGDASQDKRFLESSFDELQLITGQKPQIMKSKKSIADFKVREGQPVGLRVTLRRKLMWSFLEKLFCIALPRTRDFRGISSKAFDKSGNLTIGVREQIIFTEIHYDAIKKVRGMNITFVTSSNNCSHAKELLTSLGCPFSKEN